MDEEFPFPELAHIEINQYDYQLQIKREELANNLAIAQVNASKDTDHSKADYMFKQLEQATDHAHELGMAAMQQVQPPPSNGNGANGTEPQQESAQ